MNTVSTHVLDTSAGKPLAGLSVTLEAFNAATQSWSSLLAGTTDGDGRFGNRHEGAGLQEGFYCFRFDTSRFSELFPEVAIRFRIVGTARHTHIPLLLSPYGYTTYRGS
jgi:5-hydroxyisourate hydrolase